MANSYLNEYNTIAEMNTAYEEGHDESWVAYCAEDNSLYYQQKTKIASKYFDNLEYNSENKTLEFYIDGDLKKSIDVSPWWFEKDSYYTREETNELLSTKFDSVKYDSSARTINFYVGEEIKNSIDATDFIKDGMVNTVTVEVINGVSYLAITFNEDEEGKKTHDTIYLELTKIFNPENYYTKTASDSKYVNAIGTSGNNLTYTIGDNTNNLTVPYANSTPWSGISGKPQLTSFVQYYTGSNFAVKGHSGNFAWEKPEDDVTGGNGMCIRFLWNLSPEYYTDIIMFPNGKYSRGIYYRQMDSKNIWVRDGITYDYGWELFLSSANYTQFYIYPKLQIGSTVLTEEKLKALLELI